MKIPKEQTAHFYREAAERVLLGIDKYSCNAIMRVVLGNSATSYGESQPMIDRFAKYFKPEDLDARYAWPFSGREHRVLSLLLMAEMAEQGDI
jgi:hypothetical protein